MKANIISKIKLSLKITVISLLLLVYKTSNAQWECLFQPGLNDFEILNGVGCENWINYAAYPDMDILPLKTVKVIFHIMQDENGNGNLYDIPAQVDFLNEIITDLNSRLGNLDMLTLQVSSPYITDSRIRVYLDEIYFHQDEDLWNFNGNNISTFLPLIYQKYVLDNPFLNDEQKYHTLHLIIGGGNVNAIGGRASGLGDKKYIGLRGFDYAYFNHPYAPWAWGCAITTCHEFGHSCGLKHNFHGGPNGYQCDDCYDNDPPGLPCPIEGTSNNMMDYYPGGGGGFSECQVGKMHYYLAGKAGNISEDVIYDCNENNPVIIGNNQNIEWYFDNKVPGDIVIESNSILTIRCVIALPLDGKVIIQPGGKLILDGGTLINACGDQWQGIEVWGDPLLSQTSANQGTLEIINGGTIENATVAVRLGSKDYTNKGGGIIFAADAVFRNNNTGVKFETYSSGNFSYFDRCTFETTAGLPDNQTPQYFVMMTSVDGIDINGCTFQNTLPDSVAYADRGIGIYSVNSVFTVDKVCISGTTPCTEYRYPEFNNLNYAIKALATSSNTPCYIREGQFNYNRRGVYLSGISSATFTNNMFDMSVTQINSVANDTIYGSYFDGCTGYTFHENQYTSNFTQVPGKIALGLIINNSGPDNNLVYDNYFENVFTSTLIQGENRNNGGSTGLVIKCNQFVNTLYDIVVTYPGLFSTPYMGIALHQGANTLNNPDMAGNLFYYNLISNDYDDINNKANLFYYYYPTNTSETRLKPKDYTKNKVTLMPKSNTPSWTRENGCPEATNPGGGESESLLLQMNEAGQQIDSTQNILSLLIDAGDTESLQYEVETSTSSSSMQVYNELMNTSPYLSDTVVSTAIEKEDVLPNAMLRDVMVANPNTAKSDELLSKLDSRWDPMPDYMKAQILQGRSIVSLREETEANLSALKLKKSLAFYGLVNHYLTKPDLDSLALLFASDNTLSSKYRLAFLYLGKGDVTEGTAVLSAIPSQFGLTSQDLTSHQSIVDYYTLLAAMPQGIFEADSVQLEQIHNIASNVPGEASVYARNLLLALDKTAYNEPILLPDLYKSAEAVEAYENLLNTGQPPSLKVYPNPSKDYVIIEFLTTDLENAMIEITDSNGRSLNNIQLQSNRDQLVVDTHNWKPGIYFIVLKTGSKTIESTKLSIIR